MLGIPFSLVASTRHNLKQNLKQLNTDHLIGAAKLAIGIELTQMKVHAHLGDHTIRVDEFTYDIGASIIDNHCYFAWDEAIKENSYRDAMGIEHPIIETPTRHVVLADGIYDVISQEGKTWLQHRLSGLSRYFTPDGKISAIVQKNGKSINITRSTEGDVTHIQFPHNNEIRLSIEGDDICIHWYEDGLYQQTLQRYQLKEQMLKHIHWGNYGVACQYQEAKLSKIIQDDLTEVGFSYPNANVVQINIGDESYQIENIDKNCEIKNPSMQPIKIELSDLSIEEINHAGSNAIFNFDNSSRMKSFEQDGVIQERLSYDSQYGNVATHAGIAGHKKTTVEIFKSEKWLIKKIVSENGTEYQVYNNKFELRYTLSAAGRVTYYSDSDYAKYIYRFESFFRQAFDIDALEAWVTNKKNEAEYEEIYLDRYGHDAARVKGGVETASTHDLYGNRTSYKGERESSSAFDSVNRCTKSVNDFSSKVSIFERSVTSIEHKGKHKQSNDMKIIRNQGGRVIAEESIINRLKDAFDQISKIEKQTLQHERDSAGRVRKLKLETGKHQRSIRNWCDGSGNKIASLDEGGILKVYTRDISGKHIIYIDEYAVNAIEYQDKEWSDIDLSELKCIKHLATVYDEADEISYEIDGNGFVTEFERDKAGNIIRQSRYDEKYNGRENLSALHEFAQHHSARHTYHCYDKDNYVIATIDPSGALTRLIRDGIGRIKEKIEYERFVLKQPTRKRLAAEIDAVIRDINESQENRSTRYYYHPSGKLAASIDPEGFVTTYDYNERNRLIAEKIYAIPLSECPDNLTLLLKEIEHISFTGTYYERDSLNRITASVDETGLRTLYSYLGDSERVVSKIEFDANVSSDATLTEKPRCWLYRYDGKQRLVQTLNPEVVHQNQLEGVAYDAIDWASLQKCGARNSYNGFDNPYLKIDENNDSYHCLYDISGKLRFVISGEGHITELNYTPPHNKPTSKRVYNKKMTALSDIEGAEGMLSASIENAIHDFRDELHDSITLMEYDMSDRVTCEVNPEGLKKIYNYNAHEELEMLLEDLTKTCQRSTKLNRNLDQRTVETIIKEHGKSIRNKTGRNAFGETHFSVDGNGVVHRFIFDKRGLLIRIERPDGTYVHQTWDAMKRLLVQTYPSLKTTIDATINRHKQHEYQHNIVTIIDVFNRAVKHLKTVYKKDRRIEHETGISEQFEDNRLGILSCHESFDTIDQNRQTTRQSSDLSGNIIGHATQAGARTSVDALAYGEERAISLSDHTGTKLRITQSFDHLHKIKSKTRVSNKQTIEHHFENNLSGDRISESVLVDGSEHKKSWVKDRRGRIREERLQGLNPSLKHSETFIRVYDFDLFNMFTNQSDLIGEKHRSKLRQGTDGNANIVYQCDGMGRETHLVYDALNRLRFKIGANGEVTEWRYKPGLDKAIAKLEHDRPIKLPKRFRKTTNLKKRQRILEPLVQGGTHRLSEYAYDKGERLTLALECGSLRAYDYDGHDKVYLQRSYDKRFTSMNEIQRCDLSQECARMKYTLRDRRGRIRFKIDGEGFVTEYRYENDHAHKKSHVIRYPERFQDVIIDYDSFKEHFLEVCDLGHAVIEQYFYDAYGNCTLSVDPSGVVRKQTFDPYDQIESIKTLTLSLKHDKARLFSQDEILHAFDKAAKDAKTIFYERDDLHRIKTQIVDGVRTEFSYNCLNQILSSLSEDLLTTNRYDDLRRLIEETVHAIPVALVHDKGDDGVPLGDKLKQLELLSMQLETVVKEFSYNNNDELTSVVSGVIKERAIGVLMRDAARQVDYQISKMREGLQKKTLQVGLDNGVHDVLEKSAFLTHGRAFYRSHPSPSIKVYNSDGRVAFILRPDAAIAAFTYNTHEEVCQHAFINEKFPLEQFQLWQSIIEDHLDGYDILVDLHAAIASFCSARYLEPFADYFPGTRIEERDYDNDGNLVTRRGMPSMRPVVDKHGGYTLYNARELEVLEYDASHHMTKRTTILEAAEAYPHLGVAVGDVLEEVCDYQRHFRHARVILSIDPEGYPTLKYYNPDKKCTRRWTLEHRITDPKAFISQSVTEIESYFDAVTHDERVRHASTKIDHVYDKRNRLTKRIVYDEIVDELQILSDGRPDLNKPPVRTTRDITYQYEYKKIDGMPLTWRVETSPAGIKRYELLRGDKLIAHAGPLSDCGDGRQKCPVSMLYPNAHGELATQITYDNCELDSNGLPRVASNGVIEIAEADLKTKRETLISYNNLGDETTRQNPYLATTRVSYDAYRRRVRSWSYRSVMLGGVRHLDKSETVHRYDAAGREVALYLRVAGALIDAYMQQAINNKAGQIECEDTGALLARVRKSLLDELKQNAKDIDQDGYFDKVLRDHNAFGELISETAQQMTVDQGEFKWSDVETLKQVYDDTGFAYKTLHAKPSWRFKDITGKAGIVASSIKTNVTEMKLDDLVQAMKRAEVAEAESAIQTEVTKHDKRGDLSLQLGPKFKTESTHRYSDEYQLVVDHDNESLWWPALDIPAQTCFDVILTPIDGPKMMERKITASLKDGRYQIDISALEMGKYHFRIKQYKDEQDPSAIETAEYLGELEKDSDKSYFAADGSLAYLHDARTKIGVLRLELQDGSMRFIRPRNDSTTTKTRFDINAFGGKIKSYTMMDERSLTFGKTLVGMTPSIPVGYDCQDVGGKGVLNISQRGISEAIFPPGIDGYRLELDYMLAANKGRVETIKFNAHPVSSSVNSEQVGCIEENNIASAESGQPLRLKLYGIKGKLNDPKNCREQLISSNLMTDLYDGTQGGIVSPSHHMIAHELIHHYFPDDHFVYLKTTPPLVAIYADGTFKGIFPTEPWIGGGVRVDLSNQPELRAHPSLRFQAVDVSAELEATHPLDCATMPRVRECALQEFKLLCHDGVTDNSTSFPVKLPVLKLSHLEGNIYPKVRIRPHKESSYCIYPSVVLMSKAVFQHGNCVNSYTVPYPRLYGPFDSNNYVVEFQSSDGTWHAYAPLVMDTNNTTKSSKVFEPTSLQMIEDLPENIDHVTITIRVGDSWHKIPQECITIAKTSLSFQLRVAGQMLKHGSYDYMIEAFDSASNRMVIGDGVDGGLTGRLQHTGGFSGVVLSANDKPVALARKRIESAKNHARREIYHAVNGLGSFLGYTKSGGLAEIIEPKVAAVSQGDKLDAKRASAKLQQELRLEDAARQDASDDSSELPKSTQVSLATVESRFFRNQDGHLFGKSDLGGALTLKELNQSGHALKIRLSDGTIQNFTLNGYGDWLSHWFGAARDSAILREVDAMGKMMHLHRLEDGSIVMQIKSIRDEDGNEIACYENGVNVYETARLGYMLKIVRGEDGVARVSLSDAMGKRIVGFDEACFDVDFNFYDYMQRVMMAINAAGVRRHEAYDPYAKTSKHTKEERDIHGTRGKDASGQEVQGVDIEREINACDMILAEHNNIEGGTIYYKRDGLGRKSSYVVIDSEHQIQSSLDVARNAAGKIIVLMTKRYAIEFHRNQSGDIVRYKLYVPDGKSFKWLEQDSWSRIEDGRCLAANLTLDEQGVLQPVSGRTISQTFNKDTGLVDKRLYKLEREQMLEQAIHLNSDGFFDKLLYTLNGLSDDEASDLVGVIRAIEKTLDLRGAKLARDDVRSSAQIKPHQLDSVKADGASMRPTDIANNFLVNQHGSDETVTDSMQRDKEGDKHYYREYDRVKHRAPSGHAIERESELMHVKDGELTLASRTTIKHTQCVADGAHRDVTIESRQVDIDEDNHEKPAVASSSKVYHASTGALVGATINVGESNQESFVIKHSPEGVDARYDSRGGVNIIYHSLDSLLFATLRAKEQKAQHGDIEVGDYRYNPSQLKQFTRDLLGLFSVYHDVKEGDTLDSIITEYGYPDSARSLVKAHLIKHNGLVESGSLSDRQRISLPQYFTENAFGAILEGRALTSHDLVGDIVPHYPREVHSRHASHRARTHNIECLDVALSIASAAAGIISGGVLMPVLLSTASALGQGILNRTANLTHHIDFTAVGEALATSLVTQGTGSVMSGGAAAVANASKTALASTSTVAASVLRTGVMNLEEQLVHLSMNAKSHFDTKSMILSMVESALNVGENALLDMKAEVDAGIRASGVMKNGMKAAFDASLEHAIDHKKNFLSSMAQHMASNIAGIEREHREQEAQPSKIDAMHEHVLNAKPRPDHPDLHAEHALAGGGGSLGKAHHTNHLSPFIKRPSFATEHYDEELLDYSTNRTLGTLGFMAESMSVPHVEQLSRMNPELLYNYRSKSSGHSARMFGAEANALTARLIAEQARSWRHYLPHLPDGFVNGSAGFGDGFSLGFFGRVRDRFDIGNVNRGSNSYQLSNSIGHSALLMGLGLGSYGTIRTTGTGKLIVRGSNALLGSLSSSFATYLDDPNASYNTLLFSAFTGGALGGMGGEFFTILNNPLGVSVSSNALGQFEAFLTSKDSHFSYASLIASTVGGSVEYALERGLGIASGATGAAHKLIHRAEQSLIRGTQMELSMGDYLFIKLTSAPRTFFPAYIAEKLSEGVLDKYAIDEGEQDVRPK